MKCCTKKEEHLTRVLHKDLHLKKMRMDYSLPKANPRPAIDCEVVGLSKEESRYAEEVESRLRAIGLTCNIGYPAPQVPVNQIIDRIIQSGTLYAVILQVSNAKHRSLTLQVLHGVRQEHRNMPIEDAIAFVARNFNAYLKGINEPPPQIGVRSQVPLVNNSQNSQSSQLYN